MSGQVTKKVVPRCNSCGVETGYEDYDWDRLCEVCEEKYRQGEEEAFKARVRWEKERKQTRVCINCNNLDWKSKKCKVLNIKPNHSQFFIDNSECSEYIPRCRGCGKVIENESEIIYNILSWRDIPSNRSNRKMIFCSVKCKGKTNFEMEQEYLTKIRAD